MIVEVAEVGDRPKVWTRARLNAPAGVKKLGELFSRQRWADKTIVMLDWQPEEIEHASEPVVRVYVFKRVDGHLLTLDQRYSVTDLFEKDIASPRELGWITEEFKKKLDFELQRRGVH